MVRFYDFVTVRLYDGKKMLDGLILNVFYHEGHKVHHEVSLSITNKNFPNLYSPTVSKSHSPTVSQSPDLSYAITSITSGILSGTRASRLKFPHTLMSENPDCLTSCNSFVRRMGYK